LYHKSLCRLIAVFESEGCRFESCRARFADCFSPRGFLSKGITSFLTNVPQERKELQTKDGIVIKALPELLPCCLIRIATPSG
jgi:hypothetical protein